MAKKAPDAFRTISEVSDALDTPAHVLRFWESKFSQIKPIKRAGGRRYYRPDDIALLGGIKTVLHDQGMTIKGAQKLLREKGVKHVASLGPIVQAAPVATKPSKPKRAAKPAATPVVEKAPVVAAAQKTQTVATERPIRLAAVSALKAGSLHHKSDKIAPLVARLETVRDRMRAS